MATECNQNVGPAGYNRNEPGLTEKADRIPARIVREETVTMTAEQYDNAVEALAVLLNRHWDAVRANPSLRRDDLTLAA